jgi:hypothetical protein
MPFFNVAGPCFKGEHYIIDPSTRMNGVKQLIENKQYFIIHAARQSGKTTCLLDLTKHLNASGQYCALYCSLEALQSNGKVEDGIPAAFELLADEVNFTLGFDISDQYRGKSPVLLLKSFITGVAQKAGKPLVILFDEADCMSDELLITFLRQLRDGYVNRERRPFAQSIALVGMRNIRDYKAHVRPDSETLGSASPFNIVAKSMTINNFTKEEMLCLYRQHTDATGQVFETEANNLIWQQTCGQPWLVNAIANEVIAEILQNDYSKPVTAALVEEAIQNMILNRPTHLDSLLERLKEPRVRHIIEPLIMGELLTVNKLSDDYQFTKDLGLIKETIEGVKPSNPIYAEVIGRLLSSSIQDEIREQLPQFEMPRYLRDGKIDVDMLLADFQQLWRENSEMWTKKVENYIEAEPHLVLQGFLQRVINGGGQIIRDMAVGSGRLDLCLVYDGQYYPVEVKLWRGEKYYDRSINQIVRYMDTFGCTEGWLIIFDRRKGKTWDEKIYMYKETVDGKTVTVAGG